MAGGDGDLLSADRAPGEIIPVPSCKKTRRTQLAQRNALGGRLDCTKVWKKYMCRTLAGKENSEKIGKVPALRYAEAGAPGKDFHRPHILSQRDAALSATLPTCSRRRRNRKSLAR